MSPPRKCGESPPSKQTQVAIAVAALASIAATLLIHPDRWIGAAVATFPALFLLLILATKSPAKPQAALSGTLLSAFFGGCAGADSGAVVMAVFVASYGAIGFLLGLRIDRRNESATQT